MKVTEITALGIEPETAEKIVEMAKAEIAGNYIPKSRFDEVNEAKKNAEALIAERDSQLADLKKSAGESEALKEEITKLQEANKTALKEYEASVNRMKLDNAVEKAIEGARGKNVKAIRALLNLENAKLAEDGTVEGLADQIKSLTESEETSFLFAPAVPEVTGFVPANGTGSVGSKPDFSKMTYSEICEYQAQNPTVKIS